MLGIIDNEKVNKMAEDMENLKDDVSDLKTHRIECDDRHRRHDDKINIMMADVSEIRKNTTAIANGEAAKEIIKDFIYSLAKMLAALSVILASLWHGLDYVIKLASVAH